MRSFSAVIADDEATLRSWLRHRLMTIWPELSILGEAENGLQALDLIRTLAPDIAFLDIRMPGLSGLEVAAQLAGTCRIVFVSAYDQYAVDAFEQAAVDYLLKPITPERLEKTVRRLQRGASPLPMPLPDLAALFDGLIQHTRTTSHNETLQWIRVARGETVRLIPVADVCFFQARDKYTAVLTREAEFLIRKPVRELASELDPQRFWQIHRATIVNVACIRKVSRSISGRFVLKLKDRPDVLTVSRRYTQLFKQM
jgi:DNA-binding LytR/AlgR family response regulator